MSLDPEICPLCDSSFTESSESVMLRYKGKYHKVKDLTVLTCISHTCGESFYEKASSLRLDDEFILLRESVTQQILKAVLFERALNLLPTTEKQVRGIEVEFNEEDIELSEAFKDPANVCKEE